MPDANVKTVSDAFELLIDLPCQVGEGPLWHPDEAVLYFVDIPAGRLYRYDPATGEHAVIYEGRPVGGYTLRQDGTLLLFRDRGNIVTFTPNGMQPGAVGDTIVDSIPGLDSTRFNDVIADPLGGVFCGTMTSDDVAGRLYRLTPEGELCQLLDDQGTPNGMGFSPDRRTLYYQDSRKATLYAFAFDPETGDTSDFRVLRKAKDEGDRGRGDGMTIDGQGRVWSSRWGGACVLQGDAQGVPETAYELPADNITSCCFGGANMDELYVTSASGPQRPETGALAGSLFRVKPGCTGVAEFRAAL